MRRGLGLLAAAVLLLIASGAPAGAVPPDVHPEAYRDQPPLAYISRGKVLVLDGKGHAPRPVRGVTGACCVAWAPDAKHIAFQHGAELWVARGDGSDAHRVTRSASRWEWSADGGALAVIPFTTAAPPRGVVVHSVIKPGVRQTFLGDRQVLDIAWAPIGRRLAVSLSTPSELLMLEVPGPYGEDCPALCPEPAQPLTITAGGPGPSDAVYLAGWTPDIDAFAFWVGSRWAPTVPPGPSDLALVPGTGGAAVPVARTAVDRSSVTWSKSGERLLVVGVRAAEGATPAILELCRPRGPCQPLTQGGLEVEPAWSDDGRFAFVRRGSSTAAGRLVVADANGTNPTEVGAAGDGVARPVWTPDTRRVLFTRDAKLWLVDPDHGDAVAIAGPVDETLPGQVAFARAP